MKPKECFNCGCKDFMVGQAETQVGRTIYPHWCPECGTVYATFQANKAELAAWRSQHGEPQRVLTRTERKIAEGKPYMASATAGKFCEVCGSEKALHVHHWAPVHLFGAEAAKWPTSILCQPCHSHWHSRVTPRMGRRNA
jgi:hypothetical protein